MGRCPGPRAVALLAAALAGTLAACSSGTSSQGAASKQAVDAATASIGHPGAGHLAVAAFNAYGGSARADGGNSEVVGLRSSLAHVLAENYTTVQNTVAYGVAPGPHPARGCPAALSPAPAGTDLNTVGDPSALAYAISGISKDQTAHREVQQAALSAATGQAGASPQIPALEALGFVVGSRDAALSGSGAADAVTVDVSALNRWINTTFAFGASASANAINIEATQAVDRGTGQAYDCLSKPRTSAADASRTHSAPLIGGEVGPTQSHIWIVAIAQARRDSACEVP